MTACGSSAPTTTATAPGNSSTPGSTSTKLDDTLVSQLAAATISGDYRTPLDSTPDVDGTNIYFTASNAHGSGVFKVPTAGGSATALFVGSPFMGARGITMSPDGQRLYIADPMANQIFSLAINGGTPTPLRGSSGTQPQNLHAATQNGHQIVYFTGIDTVSRQPALLTLPATGASQSTIIAKGTPLMAPDGVVVTQAGVVYVSDHQTGNASGKIFKITGTTVSTLIDQAYLGNPAGITLSPDESILLASAFQSDRMHDQVLLISLSDGRTGAVTKGVGENMKDSGGLHASPGKKNILSWCGIVHGGNGTVYAVSLF